MKHNSFNSLNFQYLPEIMMNFQKEKENMEDKKFTGTKIVKKRAAGEGSTECFVKYENLEDSPDARRHTGIVSLNLPETCKDSLKHERKACGGAFENINCLPKEILIKIFRYFTQNELGSIALVCKTWYELTRCPLLWLEVDVRFHWRHKSQNKVASIFSENLLASVTYLKLDFCIYAWEESLKFESFSVMLGKKCPSLQSLILHHASFSVNLQSAIDLCTQQLPNLKILSFHNSTFKDYCIKANTNDFSKIEIMDFFNNDGFGNASNLTFSKMINLKRLNLVSTGANDNWFQGDCSFLSNLQLLNLQWSKIGSKTFQKLKMHAFKLTELYLCATDLNDSDFNFTTSAFPQLMTVCLKGCYNVTCESIVSLICTCKFLKNVYVDEEVAETYAVHPFVIANQSKLVLQIVKTTFNCWPIKKTNYLCYQ